MGALREIIPWKSPSSQRKEKNTNAKSNTLDLELLDILGYKGIMSMSIRFGMVTVITIVKCDILCRKCDIYRY